MNKGNLKKIKALASHAFVSKEGAFQELNSGPLTHKAIIMQLDQMP
jgi:hypothetical protein